MMKRIYIFAIAAAFFLVSCKDDGVSPNPEPSYRYVFEIEYINFAWGYSHHGIYIDSAGRLFQYSYEGSSDIWHPDSTGFYTQEQLASKYSHRNTLMNTLRRDTVNKYFRMIEAAALGTYSDTTATAADMGEFAYIAYKYNPVTKKYQQVVLRVEGDFTFLNQSQSAMTIAGWLKAYLQEVF
jgi:hypothetical protein